MRMLDLQVGSKSIRNALWLSGSWHLCDSLAISLLQLFLLLLMEMFLVSLTKPAIQQCWCSGPASPLRGGRSHAGAFVRVSVCSGMHVCVAVRDDIPCQRTEWASSVPCVYVQWLSMRSFLSIVKKKKKGWGEAGNCSCAGTPCLSHNFSPVGLRLEAGQCAWRMWRMLRPTACHR